MAENVGTAPVQNGIGYSLARS